MITSPKKTKRPHRPAIISGNSDENNEIDQHEGNNNSLDVIEPRVFISSRKAIIGSAIEIGEGVEDKDEKNTSLNWYFLYIWLIVENYEVHVAKSQHQHQQRPTPTRLNPVEQVVQTMQLRRVNQRTRLSPTQCVTYMRLGLLKTLRLVHVSNDPPSLTNHVIVFLADEYLAIPLFFRRSHQPIYILIFRSFIIPPEKTHPNTLLPPKPLIHRHKHTRAHLQPSQDQNPKNRTFSPRSKIISGKV